VNATVTYHTSSVNGVSLPAYLPHGRVTVHGCAMSPLTECQVTSRPRDRVLRFSKWLNTFRTGLIRSSFTSTRSQTEDPLTYSHQTPKPNLEGRPKLNLEDVKRSESPTRLSKQFQALSYCRTRERQYRIALDLNLVLGSCAGGISRSKTAQGTSGSTGNHIL